MSDFDSFMSYELTHNHDEKSRYNKGGGCLSGCATTIAFAFVVAIFVILVFIHL